MSPSHVGVRPPGSEVGAQLVSDAASEIGTKEMVMTMVGVKMADSTHCEETEVDNQVLGNR